MIALIDKPTLAQLSETRPEGLWHWLASLPQSFEAEILCGLLLSGFLGALVSWLVKWTNGEASGLLDYCFKNSAKRTAASVLAFLGVIAGFIALEIFTTASGEFVGWMNVMVNGFMAGSGSDAMINKGKRLVWDQQTRITKQIQPPPTPEPVPIPPPA